MTVDGDLGGESGDYKSPSTVRFLGGFFSEEVFFKFLRRF